MSSLENAIDVWTFSTDAVSTDLQGYMRTCLTEEEKIRVSKFIRPNDRVLHLCARAFLRHVLSRYNEVSPSAWTFKQNEYGKPFISNLNDDEALYFNLSHTQGMVVCAVGQTEAIGVDVESVARDLDCLRLAESVFAPAEIEALQACDEAGRAELFFRFWTLKESYIKAVGMGLSHPLDNFWFDLSNDQHIGLSFSADAKKRQGWFYQNLLPNNFMLALGVLDSPDRADVNLREFTFDGFLSSF